MVGEVLSASLRSRLGYLHLCMAADTVMGVTSLMYQDGRTAPGSTVRLESHGVILGCHDRGDINVPDFVIAQTRDHGFDAIDLNEQSGQPRVMVVNGNQALRFRNAGQGLTLRLTVGTLDPEPHRIRETNVAGYIVESKCHPSTQRIINLGGRNNHRASRTHTERRNLRRVVRGLDYMDGSQPLPPS